MCWRLEEVMPIIAVLLFIPLVLYRVEAPDCKLLLVYFGADPGLLLPPEAEYPEVFWA